MIVTPHKLGEDDWGIRIKTEPNEDPPQVGEVVTVRAKSGKTWPEQIEAFVSSGDHWWICRTCAPPRQARSHRVPKEQESLLEPVDTRMKRNAEPQRMDVDPDENWDEDGDELPF